MRRLSAITLAASALGFALATSTVAQESQEDFPRQTTSEKSCQDVEWNSHVQEQHPRLIEACQAAAEVDGQAWARFHAKFQRVQEDGKVVFAVHDQRGRAVEDVILTPARGQLAHIDGRETRFQDLPTGQTISLYMPEGQYGFATQAGAPHSQLATVTARAPSSNQGPTSERASRSGVLPSTASSLPWLSVLGFLALLGGLALTLRRVA
jgi:LPXTG-motif cell wall-anchored protein